MGAAYEDDESKNMFQMPRLASETVASTAQDRDRDRADKGLLDPELNDHDNDRYDGRYDDRHSHDRHSHDRHSADRQEEMVRALIEQTARPRGAKPSIWSVYVRANMCAILRTLWCIPIAGLAIYMLVPGAAQYKTVLPYAALTLAVAVIHILLASHRTISPASSTSALPSRLYLSALAVSPILLLASIAYGAAVLHLTKQYYDVREDHVVRCGRRSRRKWCRPKTREAVVFDCVAVAVSFAGVSVLISFAQCWFIYTLHRNKYSAMEIAKATDISSPMTFTSVMKDAFKGWFRRWKK